MPYISGRPTLHDIGADYSPQYVKLARILGDKIQSGEYQPSDMLPAADLAREYKVSIGSPEPRSLCSPRTRYVSRLKAFTM